MGAMRISLPAWIAVAAAAFAGAALVAACCCGSTCIKPPPCCKAAASASATPAPAVSARPAATADAHSTLHNVKRLSANFVRGAVPEGDAAFAEIAAMGVKTVVSDDGARPDVATAKRHGLRYVHIPIGYDGIPTERMFEFEKAYTSLPGPFYVHCHHGQHRGPAGCMVGRMLLDGITAEQAVAEMKEAGTDPRYKGLYAVPGQFVRATAEQLAAIPVPPPVEAIPGFQQAMVTLDQGWTRVQDAKKAGWATPADHPDVTPEHEALMLAELLRELGRREEVGARPDVFRSHLATAEKAAWEMETALRTSPADAKAAVSAFDRVQQSCAACHAAYRDNK